MFLSVVDIVGETTLKEFAATGVEDVVVEAVVVVAFIIGAFDALDVVGIEEEKEEGGDGDDDGGGGEEEAMVACSVPFSASFEGILML